MAELHMYRNSVVEWFVAESKEEAAALARKYLLEVCGCDEDEIDLEFYQESDDKPLKIDNDGAIETRLAGEWARSEGKGFFASTEY